jgi:transcriptional regulator with GAF, ATPase, and Fis domain
MMFEHMICRVLKNVEELAVAGEPEIILAAEKKNGSRYSDELVKNFLGNPLPMVEQVEVSPTYQQTGDELLLRISQEMASKLDLHNLLSRVLCLTVEYAGAAGGSIVVLDENYEVVDGALTYAGKIQESLPDHLKEPLRHGLAGWVLENRQPALVMNTKKDPRWLSRNWESSLDLTRSAICVPLMNQERVFGILTLTRLQSNHFTMEDLSLLTSVTLALSYSFSSKTQMYHQDH